MSYVVALPAVMSEAATNVASIGSVLAAANEDVAGATAGVLAAAEDEVSAAVAALYSAHGQAYQALGAQARAFHQRFVRALAGASEAYAAAEVANASPLKAFEQSLLGVQREIQQAASTLASGVTESANTIVTGVFGAAAAPPFPAMQVGTLTDIPSLANRLQPAALWPAKPLLNLFEAQLAGPSNTISQLMAGEVSPLDYWTGNAPSPFLTWLMGQTVQYYTTSDGMRVVQITPANPTGEHVVALHGGGFILGPSIFHWVQYSVTANLTGATIQAPIYPLVWQGGTAGAVVPATANLISSLITQHGVSNVSVTGDSAGGNLALASVQYLVSQGQPVPSSMVLVSPWLDMGTGSIARQWAGNLPLNSYLVSPQFGSLAGLPPTYVYSGSWDSLVTQAFDLERAAVAQGAPISFILGHGNIHDWILTPPGYRYLPQIHQQLGIVR